MRWLRIAAWIAFVAALIALLYGHHHASAHEIYTGLSDRSGRACCGAQDCEATHYRERGGEFEFNAARRSTESGNVEDVEHPDWMQIPMSKIIFLPIAGDPGPAADDHDPSHYAHLCRNDYDYGDEEGSRLMSQYSDQFFKTESGKVHLIYCIFVPPGSI